MGICASSENSNSNKLKIIPDRYTQLVDVQNALRESQLEGVNLIFAIDCTQSNQTQGSKTFHNQSLHTIEPYRPNPYQTVIRYLGETLEPFDEDHKIPAYGFGDFFTKHKKVFNLKSAGTQCEGFKEVIEAYNAIMPLVTLSGPTSFAPIINHSLEIIKHIGTYHILIIITDGAVDDSGATEAAIIEASKYPLSIVVVGVGDGPWNRMIEFDDHLPQREFDNFQFVNFNKVVETALKRNVTVEVQFAIDALQEIPAQYQYLKKNKKLILPGTSQMNSSWEYLRNDPSAPQQIAVNFVTDEKKDETLCCICEDFKADGVIVPCGHTICFEGKCKNSIKECHICRQPIQTVIKYYQQ